MTTTTATGVSDGAWVSLGVGPLRIAVQGGGSAQYLVADSQPGLGDVGYPIPHELDEVINTGSQIWVTATGLGRAIVLSSPVATPTAITLSDSGTYSASFTGAWQQNPGARGVMLILNVSAITGSGVSLGAQLQFGDGLGGAVAAPGALTQTITAPGASLLVVSPYVTPQTGVASLPLPTWWRLMYLIEGDNPTVTFTVTAEYLQ